MMLGEFDEARAICEGLAASTTDNVKIHPTAERHLAAIAMLKGDDARARIHVARLLEIQPEASVSKASSFSAHIHDQDFLARYLEALRGAGLPD